MLDKVSVEIKEVYRLHHKLIKMGIGFSMILLLVLGVNQVIFAQEVLEFELEIELQDREKYDIEFEVKGEQFEAFYKVPGSSPLYGDEAKAMIDPLFEQLQLNPDINKRDLQEQILSIFTIDPDQVREFELEIEFSDGSKIEID